jgi:hypothetical protein
MDLYKSPDGYLYNLHASSSSDAKRMWRQSIKEKWNHTCAYCGNTKNLTIDHIIPQCKGGTDLLENVICCCKECNNSKAHTDWEQWYYNQDFFTQDKYTAILNWITPKKNENLYRYKPRRNNAS